MAYIQERTDADGNVKYRVQIRLKGYPLQTATFNRKTDAKKWAQDTESSIRDGRHFKTSEAKKHTLADLIDRYIENVLPTKPKSQKKQTTQLLWWKDQLGSYVLADITSSLLVEHRDKLLSETVRTGNKRSPATVVRYLAALSHAFTIAVEEWAWIDDSPMRKVRKPTEPRGIVRFLENDERERLLEACKHSDNKFIYTIVVLAISTGMRKMEMMNLVWKDINLDEGYLILHETKNGERRRITLTGHAYECIKEINKVRRIDTNYVFPHDRLKHVVDIAPVWKKAVAEAKVENFRFHDLRHTAASYLAMNGASLAEIAEFLGHKTLSMVMRYAHLSEAHSASVVDRMNKKVFG